MSKKLLAGVTHSHTIASDGALTLAKLIQKAKKNRLDFLIITDHNKNCKDDLPYVPGLTLIYGTEMTYKNGHANIWGVKQAVDDFNCESYECWLEKKTEAQRRGALVSLNHPFCELCGWHWDKDISRFDALEVWNAPMHYDNLICIDWWHKMLCEGHKTPVVGGSDYHRDYVVTNLLANPVTYVYCDDNTPENILKNIKDGHTTITGGVGKTLIELSCKDAVIGDTVKITDNTFVTVSVKRLKKNHDLIVYDKTGEIYRYTSPKTEDYSIKLPVSEEGFVRAEVRNTWSPIIKFGYNLYTSKRIPSQKGISLPPMVYAMTGAMYFEE